MSGYNGFIDLTGHVYSRELMEKAGVSSSAYYHWENFKTLTKIGTLTFIKQSDLKYLPRYDRAFKECHDWGGWLPLQEFQKLIGSHRFWVDRAMERGVINLERKKIQKIIAIKIPEELLSLFRAGKKVKVLRTKLSDKCRSKYGNKLVQVDKVWFTYE